MTTLHMNTDQARATVNTMRNAYDEMLAALGRLNSSVSALQGEWMGNSATLFQGEYEQWRSALTSALDTLQMLTQRLENEINEWEAAAARL